MRPKIESKARGHNKARKRAVVGRTETTRKREREREQERERERERTKL